MTNQQETAAREPQDAPKSGCVCMGAGPAFSDFFWKCGPEAARSHFRNARVEILKGIRSLIDQRIDQLTKHQPKGTKVTVE